MDGLIQRGLEGLIAAGPVATVLGIMCYLLWKQNQALLKESKEDKSLLLRVAMRCTKAVEAVAGFEPVHDPEIDGSESDEKA